MTSFITTAAVSLTQHCPGAKARGRVTWEGVSAAGVCVLQFSNAVRTEVPLAPVGDAAAFAETVGKMVRMNGGTNIAAALTQAGAALKAGPGAAAPAPGAARLVVLLTDGRVDGYQSREAK
ncbi:hypothetical protein MNEG_15283, partial [Monoraphidium neglectum]